MLTEVFEEFAHVNVLQRDMYPSATKFEAEIIAMVADMLHGEAAGGDVCGVVTSGGSESLITALYTYREQAAAEARRHPAERRHPAHGPRRPRQGRALAGHRDAPCAADGRVSSSTSTRWPT